MVDVIVTGATGKLGSCVSQKLLDKGFSVVGVHRGKIEGSSLDRRGISEDVLHEKVDVRDFESVRDLVSYHEPDYIIHLAAVADVSKGLKDPLSTFETNIIGTANILDAVRVVDDTVKVLSMSTDKVLGDGFESEEDDELVHTCPYGTSKASAEMISKTYRDKYGLKVVCTRCVNIYGYEARPKRIVSKTVTKAMDGDKPVIFEDIEGVRNYIYVEDAAEAVIHLALNREGVFNISTGDIVGQEEVVKTILGHFSDVEPYYDERGELGEQEIDKQSMARSDFDWEPRFDFEEGVEQTIKNFKQYGYSDY